MKDTGVQYALELEQEHARSEATAGLASRPFTFTANAQQYPGAS